MSKPAGRPKGANNKVLMAFRFPGGLANSIKKIAARHRLTQTRVLELLVIRHGKEFSRVKRISNWPATDRRAVARHRWLRKRLTNFSNCCAPNPESFRGGAEQNPQVPLASEDAFAQVPGNAETAVGFNFSPTPRRTPAKAGPRFAHKQTLTMAAVPTVHSQKIQ
jgi:hypothetical protein